MKRLYMKTGLALALATLLLFCVGCTNEEVVSDHVVEYENYFKETFGDFDPTHNWSMATPVTAHIDLSNAPEGTYEVKIFSVNNGYLLKKAIVHNSTQLHFDAIKGETSVRVLARNTSNLDLAAINGYFLIENGVVKANSGNTQQGNTRAGSTVYKSGSLKTVEGYEYVAECLTQEGIHYATNPYLGLPTDDGIYYIMKLEGEDYSEGANGKYSVTLNGTTTLMNMFQIYDKVLKSQDFLMYEIENRELDSRMNQDLWQPEWNDDFEGGTVSHGYYYTRSVDIYLIQQSTIAYQHLGFYPAHYRLPYNTTETYNSWVVACEDLGGSYDYDFNDIVFDFGLVDIATTNEEWAELYLQPLAAGGTKPAYIYYDSNGDGNYSDAELVGEIHNLLNGAPTSVPVNIGGSWDVDPRMTGRIKLADVDMSQNTTTAYIDRELRKVMIFVDNDPGKGADVVWAPKKDGSNIPQMLLLPRGWDWPKEMVPIFVVYPLFKDWTTDQTKNGWITTPQSNYYQNPLK